MTRSDYGRLEERIEGIRVLLANHTQQDMEMFTRLHNTIVNMDAKLDMLLLKDAQEQGENAARKRASALLAGVISFAIAAAGIAFQWLAS